jgi:hypothetical protein
MLTVTEIAQKQIAKFFEENALRPVRVFLSNGCGGPQIAMGLDDARSEDTVFEFAGVQFLHKSQWALGKTELSSCFWNAPVVHSTGVWTSFHHLAQARLSRRLKPVVVGDPAAPGSYRCRGRYRDRDRFRRCIVVGPHARCSLSLPYFRQHRHGAVQQGFTGRVPFWRKRIQLPVSKSIFCPSIPIPIPIPTPIIIPTAIGTRTLGHG